MPPRDLIAELHAASTPVPPALRERMRLLEPPAPRRLLTRRRALLAALPVAAAAAAAAAVAVVIFTGPTHRTQTLSRAPAVVHGEAFGSSTRAAKGAPVAIPPSRGRVERYTARLALHEPTQASLSTASRQALRIAASLGGHERSVHVGEGSAQLVLAVPRLHVEAALARLSRLGTITGESVDLQDLQAGLSTADRTIARLQRRLRALRAEPPTDATARAIAAATARVQALQRQEAATRRTAHFATVSLTLSTHRAAVAPHGHGPWHGLVVAFRWLGIGLVYALAFGIPLALLWLGVRWLRRRREDALLSRA